MTELLFGLEPTLPLTRRFLQEIATRRERSQTDEPADTETASDEEIKGCIRRVLDKIRSGSRPALPRSTITVRELAALSPASRWAWPMKDGAVWSRELVQELLHHAEEVSRSSVAQAEERLHLVLSLAARLPPEACRRPQAGDLMAQAWALLADCALQRNDLAQAQWAVELARAHLDCGTGDSLVQLEVNQRLGFLEWASGETAAAKAIFEALAGQAEKVKERELEARQQLWLYLVAHQEHDEPMAEGARRRALALLGPEALPRTLRRQVEIAQRLKLSAASR